MLARAQVTEELQRECHVIPKEVAKDDNQRRCPWCWELIARAATSCDHCGKEVHPLPDTSPVASEGPAAESALPGVVAGSGTQPLVEPPVPTVDLESPSGVATWWVTAVLVYGVLLFGVAVAVPFPPAGFAIGLLAAEIIAAYLINRAIWQRARQWPASKVRRLVMYLIVAVVVLIALGWIRRRFLG
jgi:hypothetical protein